MVIINTYSRQQEIG